MSQPNVQQPAFDSWAAYYDVTDADRAPFIAFYGDLVDARTRSLLELGCGTGTVLVALAERLFACHGAAARVAGVDESTEMLRVAGARDERIEWALGDVRSPPVNGPFDLVISCFNTLQFLLTDEDLVRAFRAARELVAPEGRFAFDIYQPNIPYIGEPKVDRLARSVTDGDGRRLEIREDTSYDAGSRVLTIDWRLIRSDGPADAPLATARYCMRQHFADDVARLLEAAGFRIHERFGDFDRSPFTPRSKRQVLVCAPAA